MDMLFYLLRNQENLKHFQVYWSPGSQNLGNCHTKHHDVVNHRTVKHIYLHRKTNKIQEQEIQKGCVDTAGPQAVHTAAFLAEALNITGFQMRS